MDSDAPQVPVTQEVQPEVKDVSQTPQQPPVVPQTFPEPTIPTKPKKWLKTKILIILIVLIALGVGGFFVYKNLLMPKIGVPPVAEEKLEKEGIQPIPESILKSKFGYMAHHGDWQILQEERERYSYLSWERAHPGFANWQEIEPRKEQYHWEKIDRYVETAQEKDIQILFTVWPFTDWDQETCNLHLEWQPNDWGKDPRDFLSLAHRKGKPCDMEAYKEFLRRLVERYDGDGTDDIPGLKYPIKYWEIGNEPNIGYDFFQGSTEDYFEILKASYMTIKDIDPNATVLITALPGMLGYLPGAKLPEEARLDVNPVELFELGASRYFDIMNVHAFGESKGVRDFLKIYGAGDKPIWMTEPGRITEYPKIAEKENLPLAIVFKREFEKEFQYNVERIFIGGPESIDQALHEAILIIETPEEKEEEKKEEIIPKEEGPREVSNTTRKGTVFEDEIWSGQIDITGDILVEEGVTLTILPGTQVIISASKDLQNLFGHWECDGIKDYDLLSGKKEERSESCGIHKGEPYRDEANHISIIIRGTLKAIGTEDNRIVLKLDSLNPTIYDWNRLEIHNGILSYTNIENYRILETKGDDVEISHNNLKNIGECGICANSKAKILFNTISYAGHELVDMHNASPTIRNNTIGPNKNRCCVVIDGGSPLITGNTIKDCGSGLLLLVPPKDPNLKDNILKNNTFLNNEQNVSYGY